MDFYKLSNFQLYSIIHSRHLDAKQKAAGLRELERRHLTPEELQQLAEELSQKQKSFAKISSNILLMVLIFVVIMVLRQGSCNR